MNKNTKTKYFVQIIASAIMFLIFSSQAYASEITADNIIKFVNQERGEKGLPILIENEKLIKAAQDKLNDMIENDYFAHTSPKGITPWFWFEKSDYNYQYAGENLAISFMTAEAQHKAWMDSATHRKNILNSNYQEIGVAVGIEKVNGESSIISVQEFGTEVGTAGVNSGGQNFSNEKDSLIKSSEKNIPQVLSMKNSAFDNSQLNKVPAVKKVSGISPDELTVAGFVSIIFSFLLFASLALIPMAFLSVAFEKILIIYETKKQAPEILN